MKWNQNWVLNSEFKSEIKRKWDEFNEIAEDALMMGSMRNEMKENRQNELIGHSLLENEHKQNQRAKCKSVNKWMNEMKWISNSNENGK